MGKKTEKLTEKRKEINLVANTSGLLLEGTHANLIWTDRQTLIVLKKEIKNIAKEAVFLCDLSQCYGAIRILQPFKLSKKEFIAREEEHLVSEEEIKERWKNVDEVYAYPFKWLQQYEAPVNIKPLVSGQIFIKNIEFIEGPEPEPEGEGDNIGKVAPPDKDGWQEIIGKDEISKNNTADKLAKRTGYIFPEHFLKTMESFLENKGHIAYKIKQNYHKGSCHTQIALSSDEEDCCFVLFTPRTPGGEDLLNNKAKTIRAFINKPVIKKKKIECDDSVLSIVVGEGNLQVKGLSDNRVVFNFNSKKGVVDSSCLSDTKELGALILKNVPKNFKSLSGEFSLRVAEFEFGNVVLFDREHALKKMSDEILSQIYSETKQGKTRKEIASGTNLSKVTIWSYQKGLGLV